MNNVETCQRLNTACWTEKYATFIEIPFNCIDLPNKIISPFDLTMTRKFSRQTEINNRLKALGKL